MSTIGVSIEFGDSESEIKNRFRKIEAEAAYIIHERIGLDQGEWVGILVYRGKSKST